MEAPCFVTDIFLPNMLYAITVRSPVAKGRLVSIDCPKLSGGCLLITAKDIPGKNTFESYGFPVLADTEISYIGEPVALLVGPSKATLEDYLRQCTVNVEEAPAVFSPAQAAADESAAAGLVAARRDIRIGDPEAAFANAASVVRGTYSTGIQEHWYAERVGAVVYQEEAEEGGEIFKNAGFVIQTATQWPYHVRRSVAQVLGVPASKITVKPTETGLHMDGKFWYPSLICCHASLAASITGKPVRLFLTREEDFSFSPKRCGAEITIASALDEKGEVTGIEINTLVNLGSQGVNSAEILDHVNLGSVGVYKTKNIRLSAAAVKTNIPPQGPFAGFGLAQGFFAMERHVSHIADRLNVDPAQWRAENGIKAGLLPLGMPVKDAVSVNDLVSVAMKSSDYRRKWAAYELLRQARRTKLGSAPQESPAAETAQSHAEQSPDQKPPEQKPEQKPQEQKLQREAKWAEKGESLRGIGIAVGYQGNGLLYAGTDKGSYSIELILEKDGALEINTSMAGGCIRLWEGIASRILGLEQGMVRFNCGTEYPDAGPLIMSRSVTVVTRLVEQACLEISKRRFRDPLPIVVRKMARPQKNAAWEELLPHEGACDHGSFARPGWASAIVEVEIDPIEYLPHIRGVWMGVNGGKILDEERACKSLKASSVQALGWAYREQISFCEGKIPLDQYDDFLIPYPAEVPPIGIDFINNNSHDEPKGIGDLPFTCIPAAYAQAVSQAMDHHFRSIPLTAFDIWYAGVSKRKAGGQG